jgi:hypothetical protein
MQKKTILDLPLPSTSAIKSPVLCTHTGNLLLKMDMDDDVQIHSICLCFIKQRAFRKRAETYCTEWHIKDVYDTVCEVIDSDWVNELHLSAAIEWRDKWVLRHFMIYVDGFGCLEVICENVKLETIQN